MKKSESRKHHILTVATDIFQKKGYSVSMDELTASIGYSKATVYNYFPSKEVLFVESLLQSLSVKAKLVYGLLLRNQFATLLNTKTSSELFWQHMREFGINYLKLYLSEDTLNLNRMIIAEGARLGIGKLFYEKGTLKGWTMVSKIFKTAINKNILNDTVQPFEMAMHWKALIEAQYLEQCLRGVIDKVSQQQIEHNIDNALFVFKKAYERIN